MSREMKPVRRNLSRCSLWLGAAKLLRLFKNGPLPCPEPSVLRYRVEMLFIYGWDDAGWTEGDETSEYPLRFSSVAAAQAEIDDLVRSCDQAVKDGNMQDSHTADEFRVVPAND